MPFGTLGHGGRDGYMSKILVIADGRYDFLQVLESCRAEIDCVSFVQALHRDLSAYDGYCVLAAGHRLDARLRETLETENRKGKRIFLEAVGSFLTIYSADGVDTTQSRLIYVQPEEGEGIPGLCTGDLLDDECNRMMQPYYLTQDAVPLLVYRHRIVAHAHTAMNRAEILDGCRMGMWRCGDTVLMTSFQLHNFNRARFAPRAAWEKVIAFIAAWLTGSEPASMPKRTVNYGPKEELKELDTFERCRREAVERGVKWLRGFLVDEGRGGVLEGLRHYVDPEGNQTISSDIRPDCCGETAGAFRFFARLTGEEHCLRLVQNLEGFVYGPMVEKGGLLDGMMRWSDSGWGICYQDDVARAMLPQLYACLFLEDTSRLADVCRVLDFLVRTTAQDGNRNPRTDNIYLNEMTIADMRAAEHGTPSAHYNAYYHAALLFAYMADPSRKEYLETARRGLTTLMAQYPNTRREQSETEEMCHLVLPLAALYAATHEEQYREMLYRVTDDLEKHRQPCGGYAEWDTGYTAVCSRESTGECSILTENGDPVADMLYSCNWLPVGFAFAFHVTGDRRFEELWRGIAGFCLETQMRSNDPLTDGGWCRAFDMERGEAYAAPHDCGWATYAVETGWTVAEILMGLMLPDILELADKKEKKYGGQR